MIFNKTMKYQPQIKRIGISSFFILSILFQIIFTSIQNNIDNVFPGSRSFIVEFGSTDGYETFILSSSTKTNSNKISSTYHQKIKPDIETVYRQNEILFSSLLNEYLDIEDQNSPRMTFYSFSFSLRSPPSNLS